jgi:hypothetical protein
MVGERSLVRVLGSERVGKGVSAYLINRQRDGDADRRGGGGVEEGRGQGIGSLTSRRGRGERREGFRLWRGTRSTDDATRTSLLSASRGINAENAGTGRVLSCQWTPQWICTVHRADRRAPA